MYFTSSSILANTLVSDRGFICEKKLSNKFAWAKQKTWSIIQREQSKHVSEQSKLFFRDKVKSLSVIF